MAGKSVETMERLAVEGKTGNVENEPRIVSTPPRRKPSAEPATWIGIIFLTIQCIHFSVSFRNRRIRQTSR
jgi:hypothetical protein